MPDVVRTVQANILALIASEGLTTNGWVSKYELEYSTVYRIAKGSMDPTTSQLAKIGRAIGLEGWQLAAPDLGLGLYQMEGDGKPRLVPLPIPEAFIRHLAQSRAPAPPAGAAFGAGDALAVKGRASSTHQRGSTKRG